MVRKTTFSLHETTVESYIIFRLILFFIICVLFAEIYIIHSFIHVIFVFEVVFIIELIFPFEVVLIFEVISYYWSFSYLRSSLYLRSVSNLWSVSYLKSSSNLSSSSNMRSSLNLIWLWWFPSAVYGRVRIVWKN